MRMTLRPLRAVCAMLMIAATLCGHARQWRVADVPNVQLSDSTRYVSDPDDIIDADTESSLNATAAALRRATSAEIAIVALDEIDSSTDIDRFATDLFKEWGIGKSDKDNGVLVLLSRDSHEVTIRTGKGIEGVLPDIICGRIIREQMIPRFRDDDYGGGLLAGVGRINEVVTDPSVREELMSAEADSRGGDEEIGDAMFEGYIVMCVVLGIVCLAYLLWKLFATRRDDAITRYRALDKLHTPMLFLTVLGLGAPLLAYLLLRYRLSRLRNRPRRCAHCGTTMKKLSEEEDNHYLRPEQDAEERLNSIDYDVWLCPSCASTEVIPFVNKSSAYTECPRCHARTMSLQSDRTTVAPTTMHPGMGVKTYTCRFCGNRDERQYTIPKIVAAPIVTGGGGRGFGGGGFGGGGFGGGSTMGGGATGRW